jgi:hypothetical protein
MQANRKRLLSIYVNIALEDATSRLGSPPLFFLSPICYLFVERKSYEDFRRHAELNQPFLFVEGWWIVMTCETKVICRGEDKHGAQRYTTNIAPTTMSQRFRNGRKSLAGHYLVLSW